MRMPPYTHAYIHAPTPTHSHTFTCTHTHTCVPPTHATVPTLTLIHMHTHTHTHMCPPHTCNRTNSHTHSLHKYTLSIVSSHTSFLPQACKHTRSYTHPPLLTYYHTYSLVRTYTHNQKHFITYYTPSHKNTRTHTISINPVNKK